MQARTAELEQPCQPRAANAEIDQMLAALRKSEERLRLILDSIPALVAHVDAGQRYRYANCGYAAWFGLKKEEIVGRSVSEVLVPRPMPWCGPIFLRSGARRTGELQYCRPQCPGTHGACPQRGRARQ